MNKVIKTILYFCWLSIILFSPIFINGLIGDILIISYSQDYKKIKIKVDSLVNSSEFYSDGSESTTYYDVYSFKYNTRIRVSDNMESLLDRKLEKDRLEPHLINYMKTHNDSIWIWYHPKTKSMYAKEEDIKFNFQSTKWAAVKKLVMVLIAIFGIVYFIKNRRKMKTTNETS